ncbi:MAG: rhomboid family intramembrane serine protease [Ginsengibacter sp.]
MAFGLTPKHTEQIFLDGFTSQEYLALFLDTAETLGWDTRYKSQSGFIAVAGSGRFSARFKVTAIIEDTLATITSESTGSEMFDMNRNKKNIESFLKAMDTLKQTSTHSSLLQQYATRLPELVPPEMDSLSQPPPTGGQKLAQVFSIFIPRNDYFITPLLIDINILVFVIMVLSGAGFMSPTTESLIAWGANYTPLTLGGQWWRLFTNFFIHIGIMHLLLNMYALLFIGILLEPRLGKLKFGLAYLLTGLAGSLTSLYWHDIILSAGASGAIFGMYGVFLAMLTTNFIEKSERKPLLTSIGIFVLYNLAYGMKGNIDNAAHIGGLVTGLIIGYAFYPALRQPKSANLNYGIPVLVMLLCFTTSFMVFRRLPNDVAQYETKMKTFSEHEEAALAFYKLPKDASTPTRLAALREQGIPNWKANIVIMQQIEALHLPATLKTQADTLLEYSNDRLATYNLLCKALGENSGAYDDSLKYYNQHVSEILSNLNKKAKTSN